MGEESKLIDIDSVHNLKKKYKIRRSGRTTGASIETTIPPDAFAREAARHGMSPEEAIDKLDIVWQYNSFPGLHLNFVKKED